MAKQEVAETQEIAKTSNRFLLKTNLESGIGFAFSERLFDRV